jgi:hypothetical protein
MLLDRCEWLAEHVLKCEPFLARPIEGLAPINLFHLSRVAHHIQSLFRAGILIDVEWNRSRGVVLRDHNLLLAFLHTRDQLRQSCLHR